MNRQRAQRVMEAAGISALILCDPINIYHATGFWARTLEMGHLGTFAAVVAADQNCPAILITPQFLHYFQDIEKALGHEEIELVLTTAPDEMAPSGVAEPVFFRSTAGGPADVFEHAARAATLSLLSASAVFGSAADALRATLLRPGLQGLIAADGATAEALLGRGRGISTRAAEPLLRRIRIIKSPTEIALMRHAAHNNEAAARAAIASASVGDRYQDVVNMFFAETGKRGGQPIFLTVDSPSYAHRDGIIRAGRCFMIDAVAHYARYHGDYGRTVFVGTPEPALSRAMDAAIIASQAIGAVLAPGMRYSDVTRIGRQAVADAGLDFLVAATPHSVGLFHTDEPFRDDAMTFAKADHLIEQDMVLSIDCPILATGMGGSVHLEDLWLVTADGCEPLNDTDTTFLRI